MAPVSGPGYDAVDKDPSSGNSQDRQYLKIMRRGTWIAGFPCWTEIRGMPWKKTEQG